MKFKIEKLGQYVIMPNYHLQDKKLSLKAKGLLSVFFSLPNDWDFNVNGICSITNTGITTIRNTLAELELQGYLIREQTKNEKGQFDYIYHIFFKRQTGIKPMKNCTGLRRYQTYLNKLNREQQKNRI